MHGTQQAVLIWLVEHRSDDDSRMADEQWGRIVSALTSRRGWIRALRGWRLISRVRRIGA
jgi:hypothetical protein